MKASEYKEAMRKYRGHLKSVDNELETIHTNCSYRFRKMTLSNKSMGIRKLAYAASGMSWEEQDLFVKWLLEKTRNKNEIDTKLMEMI